MYELNLSNFFYLHPRISDSGFWLLACINNISNLEWQQIRFSSINKHEISLYLFKTRTLKEYYVNFVFGNRSIALFSKYFNYFFTTKIDEDEYLSIDKDYDSIIIKYSAFFFLKYIITFGTFLYYKKFNIINLILPFMYKVSYPYKWLCKFEITIKKRIYSYFYVYMCISLLIYNSVYYKYLNVYY